MKYSVEGQIGLFNEPIKQPNVAKVKCSWSIYAVPRYRDGNHIETVIQAYTEKQARYLFYKLYNDYLITGIYACV